MSKQALKERQPKLPWEFTIHLSWFLKVPIKTERGAGDYEVYLTPRPNYCDRGDWIIYLECHNGDLDGADGFPRYFFGSEDEVKVQMERWLERREAYRAAVIGADHEKAGDVLQCYHEPRER
jgi:hypothetical protein